ncbi:SURF1 family protein [Solilutibacter silvestris]|uniref:SURF1 family protein n=1 Tax=Solilutibacter silvestris TaxID=1645665 RepID=UPI003D33933A
MRRTVFLVALALAFCGFTALGVWQVQRLHWKHALIARVDARIHAEPVALPARKDWPQASAARDEYRHVVVTGEYLRNADTRVQAVTERGPGGWLLTPLRDDGGDAVLVNRGFVPSDWKGDVAPPAGHVRVIGLLRMSEPNGAFLRRNDPAHDRWYSRDVAAIAQARSLGDVAPWFVDAERDANAPEWPAGGMTVVRFRDQHLQYALTWFALAALSLFAAWRVYTSRDAGRPRHHA